MAYEVKCECGKARSVTAGDAGMSLRCDCGRTIEVPLLHQLRSAAGEEAFSPVVRLQSLLLHNQLPGTQRCACCDRETNGLIHFSIKCEWTLILEGGASKATQAAGCLLFGLIGGLIMAQVAKGKPTEHGQDVELTVPVRICEKCSLELTTPEAIRDALRATPEYAALLDKYPKARIARRG